MDALNYWKARKTQVLCGIIFLIGGSVAFVDVEYKSNNDGQINVCYFDCSIQIRWPMALTCKCRDDTWICLGNCSLFQMETPVEVVAPQLPEAATTENTARESVLSSFAFEWKKWR